MIPDDAARGRYYREIAAAFLKHRGAPFFLSALDLDLISRWEKSGLPLPVVLEGIESAFTATRPGARPRGKVLTLSYCEAPVARAWERHRDRKVGEKRGAPAARDRGTAARSEIDRFLSAVPPRLESLRETFLAAKSALDGMGSSEEALERLDDQVEERLRAAASAEEANAARDAVRAEHGKLARADLDQAAAVLLVKRLRAEFKVPYLALFYY